MIVCEDCLSLFSSFLSGALVATNQDGLVFDAAGLEWLCNVYGDLASSDRLLCCHGLTGICLESSELLQNGCSYAKRKNC